ncbi:S-layer homology domain-containing protein [Cytobacillus massiliigabonensis]|uniref:S-layer homology domain-containing protein n=1 Tax=Cytobacillus massiliigabonensis TaxID=1871011 RepID=UPI000C8620D9|nr:S-layer homology domain-containing protein [Cytobacillus massiliigabonensis]
MKKQTLVWLLALLFFYSFTGNASASPIFSDFSNSYSAKAEIEYLAKKGIIGGYPDGSFGVNDKITRLQASAMIIRALDLDTSNRPNPNFKDVKADDAGYELIAAVADEGIMGGNEQDEFRPSDTLTRAQMAAILVQAFQLKGKAAYSFRDVDDSHWASAAIKTLFHNGITTGYADNTFKPNQSITRSQFAVFLARVLNPNFKEVNACYKPNNEKKHVVNVAVTTLWEKPDRARAIDEPAISSHVNVTKWISSMNYPQKTWLLGKIDSQALYGQEVTILQSSGNWYKIAVKDQYSPKNSNGYPGWVPKSHITEYYPNYENCKIAIVSANKASLYNTKAAASKFLEVSFNTILPVMKEENNWLQVQTPTNEVKYMRKQDVKVFANYKSIPKPLQKDLVDTGKRFLNLPYLWAGNSAYGFDCSGFTHSIYKQHGILIPRDSTVQAQQGAAVTKNNLQPGDLMFFAHNKGKGNVHHVSMYIGDGKMIHAPNFSRAVEIVSINTEPYKSEFAGARRYLK